MTVYVVLETCCYHFNGVFATREGAEARIAEREELTGEPCDWEITEYEVNA